MKKISLLLSCLLGCSLLVGCDNAETSSENLDVFDSSPSTPLNVAYIYFDGDYVQTRSSTRPIAFDSYEIVEDDLIIYGRFIYENAYDINSLEDALNSSSTPYVISYCEEGETSITSNYENTFWKVLSIDEDDVASFKLTIDLSPIFDEGQELGILCLFGFNFWVMHVFKGYVSNNYYDYTKGINQ